MIKKLIMLMLIVSFSALLLCCAPTVSAATLLLDESDLYSDDEELYIGKLMNDFSEETGWNIGIVTIDDDYNNEQSARFKAEALYDETFGRDSTGVLYMCDVGYRYIVIANDARNYISGSRFNAMIDKVNDLYMDYDDIGSAEAFISYSRKFYDKGEGSFYLSPEAVMVAVVTFILTAAISLAVIYTSYNKHTKPETSNYSDARKLDIYRRMDVFQRQYVTRHTSSSGGGGGGGHHGGGGCGGHR